MKKGPETDRNTHPLDPNYQMPGRNELSNVNDAFGKRNAVQARILSKAVERGDNKQFLKTNEKVFSTKPQLQVTALESIGITGGTFDNIKPI